MASSLRNKVCVITGSSSGLGAASAIEFAKQGARLMLHGRNEAALGKISKQCTNEGLSKNEVTYVTGDICEEETLTRIKEETLHKYGRVDVLFNNAGYTHPLDMPIHRGGKVEAMDEMYKLYVRSPYLLTQEFVPSLQETKGVVINCSSAYSRVPDPNFTGYSTMKGAMDQLTKVLAMSLGIHGIRVNSLNPGPVPTEIFNKRFGEGFNENQMVGIGTFAPLERRLATPSEIAKIVAFLASDQASTVTAQNIFCDLGISLFHPTMDLQ